jgi:hypothetical protein
MFKTITDQAFRVGVAGAVVGALVSLGGSLLAIRSQDHTLQRQEQTTAMQDRRDAYVGFLAAYSQYADDVQAIGDAHDSGDDSGTAVNKSFDDQVRLNLSLSQIRLIGAPKVTTVAERAWTTITSWSDTTTSDEAFALVRQSEQAVQEFLATARTDLSI